MAAFDFPASPAVGQAYTPPAGSPTYVWTGTGWITTTAPGAGPQTEQFYDLSGLSLVDIQVPTWAKMVQIIGAIYTPAGTNNVRMQVSADGSIFFAGATDYQSGGPIHNTGTAAYAKQDQVGTSSHMLTASSDNAVFPQMFTVEATLVRPTTAAVFGLKAYGKTLDNAAAGALRTWWATSFLGAGVTAALALKALRFFLLTGSMGAGSYMIVRWQGTSGQVPVTNAIQEAPTDSQDYVRNNGVWRPAATGSVSKISSGTIASPVSVLDVALPAGFLSYEMIFPNWMPVIDATFPCMRFSLDGSTYLAGANYAWGLNTNTFNPASNSPTGNTGQAQIALHQAMSNAGRSAIKVGIFPPIDATWIMEVMSDAIFSSGTAYARSTGGGVMNGTFGIAQAARFFPSGGNIAVGTKWQLNGVK